MNIDGVFLHYLIDEVKPLIVDARINKFISISGSEFAFLLSNKYYLFVSLNSNSPHFRLTKNDLVKSNKTNPFLSALKKYGEGSKIIDINQNGNDRSAVITLNSFDELGYKTTIHFIIELYGRNSNILFPTSSIFLPWPLIKSLALILFLEGGCTSSIEITLPPSHATSKWSFSTLIIVDGRAFVWYFASILLYTLIGKLSITKYPPG